MKRIARFQTLRDVASQIQSSPDLQVTLQTLVVATCQHPDWSLASVMAVDRPTGSAQVVARNDPNLLGRTLEDRWDLATSPALVALTRNEPVVIRDAWLSSEFPGYRREAIEHGYHTVVTMPMRCADAQGRSMVFTVISRRTVDIAQDDLAFLGTIVHLGEMAVERSHRMRAESRLTERLQTALAVHASLMGQILADGSLASVTATVGELLPDPIIVVDLSANLVIPGRSPSPDRYDDPSWQAAARDPLSSQLVKAARRGAASPQREASIILHEGGSPFKIVARVEPLTVDGQLVGMLMVLSGGIYFEKLDNLLLDSAKFALSVQMMRGFIRFQADSQTLSELFGQVVEHPARDAETLIVKARRLGVDLLAPALLVSIGFAKPSVQDRGVSLESHRSIARIVHQRHRGASVVALGEVILCHVPPPSGKAGRAEAMMRDIAEQIERTLNDAAIVIGSGRCEGPADYPPAWLQCQRVMHLARRFGRRGSMTVQDFGPFPLLLAAVEAGDVQSFVDRSIGALARHDDNHRTRYLETLRCYLDCGCRTQAAAESINVHVTTLRYRLSRMQKLFGIEIDTPQQRFSLELAMRLNAMLGRSAPVAEAENATVPLRGDPRAAADFASRLGRPAPKGSRSSRGA